jgi:hypothetical protein
MNPRNQLQTFNSQIILKTLHRDGLVKQSVRVVAIFVAVVADEYHILFVRADVNGRNAVTGVSANHPK